MATHREKQDCFYDELCQKYGKKHSWVVLTADEKNRMRALKKLVRKEYADAIRL